MDTKKIAVWLLIIGGINWGLIGIAHFLGEDSNLNIVNILLGDWPVLENLVYVLVGVAAVWKLYHTVQNKR